MTTAPFEHTGGQSQPPLPRRRLSEQVARADANPLVNMLFKITITLGLAALTWGWSTFKQGLITEAEKRLKETPAFLEVKEKADETSKRSWETRRELTATVSKLEETGRILADVARQQQENSRSIAAVSQQQQVNTTAIAVLVQQTSAIDKRLDREETRRN